MSALIEAENFQLRDGGLNPAQVRIIERAFRKGQPVDPISVGRIGTSLFILDGFHRVAAARAAELSTVTAEVASMDWQEAQTFALLANTRAGRALGARDKKQLLFKYIQLGMHLNASGRVKTPRAISIDLNGALKVVAIRQHLKSVGIAAEDEAELNHLHVGKEAASLAEAQAFDLLSGLEAVLRTLSQQERTRLIEKLRGTVEYFMNMEHE